MAFLTTKKSYTKNALLNIETKYSNSPVSAQATYLRAQMLVQSADDFNPLTNKENQFDLVKAKTNLRSSLCKISKK